VDNSLGSGPEDGVAGGNSTVDGKCHVTITRIAVANGVPFLQGCPAAPEGVLEKTWWKGGSRKVGGGTWGEAWEKKVPRDAD